MDRSEYVKRLLIALLLVGLFCLAVVAWRLLLLLFGAALVAVVLRTGSELLCRTRMPERVAVMISMLLILALMAGVAWMGSVILADDVRQLVDRLPEAWSRLKGWASEWPLGEKMISAIEDAEPEGGLATGAATAFLGAATAVADLLLVGFGGLYLAMQPRMYKRGVEKLLPGRFAERAHDLVIAESTALRLWLKGQLIAMAIVGTLTTLGLYLIGLPSALALGVIAGLAEFIPFAGPILAAIPGLLIALGEDPTTALWTLGVYVAVQQIEGNIVTPLVQHRTVSIPPVLMMFAVVASAFLFGVIGILLGAPLAVAIFVAVKQLWVHDALGREADLPGIDNEPEGEDEPAIDNAPAPGTR